MASVASQNCGGYRQVTIQDSVKSEAFAVFAAAESATAMQGHVQVQSRVRPWAPTAVAADRVLQTLLLSPDCNCCRH